MHYWSLLVERGEHVSSVICLDLHTFRIQTPADRLGNASCEIDRTDQQLAISLWFQLPVLHRPASSNIPSPSPENVHG